MKTALPAKDRRDWLQASALGWLGYALGAPWSRGAAAAGGAVSAEEANAAAVAQTGGTARALLGATGRGAPWSALVPKAWNGTLLVWAHSYRNRSDPHATQPFTTFHPGEAPYFPDLAPALLSQGFALAGAAFRNGGYAVEEGISDCADLIELMHKELGTPQRTLLYGTSLGSLVALHGAERRADLYDGALALSSLAGGATYVWDQTFEFALAYESAFGWPTAWGTVLKPNPQMNFRQDVVPTLRALMGQSDQREGLERVRQSIGVPDAGYLDGRAPMPWFIGNMFFATQARAELQRRMGGQPNQSVRYKVEADPSARGNLKRWYDPTGALRVPLLTLHSVHDGFALISNEAVLLRTVAAAGQSDRLLQLYTDRVGHNDFSVAQLSAALTALDSWVASGRRPDPARFGGENGFVPAPAGG